MTMLYRLLYSMDLTPVFRGLRGPLTARENILQNVVVMVDNCSMLLLSNNGPAAGEKITILDIFQPIFCLILDLLPPKQEKNKPPPHSGRGKNKHPPLPSPGRDQVRK